MGIKVENWKDALDESCPKVNTIVLSKKESKARIKLIFSYKISGNEMKSKQETHL